MNILCVCVCVCVCGRYNRVITNTRLNSQGEILSGNVYFESLNLALPVAQSVALLRF
jgi:hypothetical protein